ncbi:MAG: DUF4037 domain-containing protein [Clostridia bacterium]|nr:DUF4037 domain-containing protein [Clostridia bacterium]
MKGLDLAREYYEAYGKAVLEEEFADVLPYLAVGLAGSGSECYGYDDALSQDHDFEPAFCIFLPDESIVDRRYAFRLERAYAKLPKEFMGLSRSPVSPVGGSRHGVIRMEEFFLEKTGSPDGALSLEAWLSVPEHGLLEATNGAVFCDPYGRFSAIRERLSYFPEDVRRKKLGGSLLLMGQAGQYNYSRCVERGDTAAAQMAAFEFVKSVLHSIYLLNRSYMPYYKWVFRGLRELSVLSELGGELEYLVSSGNAPEEAKGKEQRIERICAAVAEELRAQGICALPYAEMEPMAYAVNDTVTDHDLRNMHILSAV